MIDFYCNFDNDVDVDEYPACMDGISSIGSIARAWENAERVMSRYKNRNGHEGAQVLVIASRGRVISAIVPATTEYTRLIENTAIKRLGYGLVGNRTVVMGHVIKRD